MEDEDVIHLNVIYDDDNVSSDYFHCMSASEIKEVFDAYEDCSEKKETYDASDSPLQSGSKARTVDHGPYYYGCEDPMEIFNAQITAMEKYETDRDKHIDDKKALDVLKTKKSLYDLKSFVDIYSNALETVRDFFHICSKNMSVEEKQWARTEIEYMKALRRSLEDLENTIYDDHKKQIDVVQTEIMDKVQLEDQERHFLAEIGRSQDMSESAISGLEIKIHSRVMATEVVDRKSLKRMNELVQEMKLFLMKANKKLLEDVAWNSRVIDFVKFLEYRNNKSRLNLWKLETNIMQVADLSAYKKEYFRVWNDADKYLSALGQDEGWKLNERYYKEYIAQVEALHTQVTKLSTTTMSKKEAFQSTEDILMKINWIENKIKFTVKRNQDSWQKECEYMEYLGNLAVLENDGRVLSSPDIESYEHNNKERVVFENKLPT